MFPSNTLLSLILITLTAVDASLVNRRTGKATLSFATKINERGSLSLVEKDRARAQAMKQDGHLGKRSTHQVNANNAGLIYTAQVGVGSPPTNYTLIIDTGSSTTWVGAGKPYAKTKTSRDTGNAISVSYGTGNFSGEEWTDTVTLAPDLVIKQQSIGVANSAHGFSGVDGILGVGPVDLTIGLVPGGATPTVTDNLLSQGAISQEVLGVHYIPAAETSNNGQLTFGGYDDFAITTPVVDVSLTKTSPASKFWGIDQSISYGKDTILSSTAGIVDTGTTLILIATDAFKVYQSKTGGTLDSATGLLKITSAQYDNLQPLVFNAGGDSFMLSRNAQIWPRSLNTAIGGSSNEIYLVVGDIGTPSGTGLDFINGYTFLERYYSVYDTAKGAVGFAATEYTFAECN